jgi:hypothetical protein
MSFSFPTLPRSHLAWSPRPFLTGPHTPDPWQDEETKPDNQAPAKAREEEERVRQEEERLHEEHIRELALEVMLEHGFKTFFEALTFVRKGRGRNGRADET